MEVNRRWKRSAESRIPLCPGYDASLISGQIKDDNEPPMGYGPHLLFGCLKWCSYKMGVDQVVVGPWISPKLRKILGGHLVQKIFLTRRRGQGVLLVLTRGLGQ